VVVVCLFLLAIQFVVINPDEFHVGFLFGAPWVGSLSPDFTRSKFWIKSIDGLILTSHYYHKRIGMSLPTAIEMLEIGKTSRTNKIAVLGIIVVALIGIVGWFYKRELSGRCTSVRLKRWSTQLGSLNFVISNGGIDGSTERNHLRGDRVRRGRI